MRDYLAEELEPEDVDFAFRWLAACALIPVLRWPLTRRIGDRLAAAHGRSAPDDDLFLALAKLPWFRTGRMPGDLRDALARTLVRKDRRVARAALAEAFEEALRPPGDDSPRSRAAAGHLARLIARLPEGELADPLLANALRGWRAGSPLARLGTVQAKLPEGLRGWLDAPRMLAAAGLAAVALASLWVMPRIDALLANDLGRKPVTVDATNLRLSACDWPSGAWGRPDFSAQSNQLVEPIVLRRIGDFEAQFPSFLAADFSAALTQDKDGATLWALDGSGAQFVDRNAPLRTPTTLAGRFTIVESKYGLWLQGVRLQRDGTNPQLSSARLLSRDGTELYAVLYPDGRIVLTERESGQQVGTIHVSGSPFAGIGADTEGQLVVAGCNPGGKVRRTGPQPGVGPTPAPPSPPVPDSKPRIIARNQTGEVMLLGNDKSGFMRTDEDGKLFYEIAADAVKAAGLDRLFDGQRFAFDVWSDGRGRLLAVNLTEIRPGPPVFEEQQPVRDDSKSPASGSASFSGAAWWHANQAAFPNSSKIDDLDPAFRDKVEQFVSALRDAGASITVSATRRNEARSLLMNYSWKVAKGVMAPNAVPQIPGVNIVWDHGDAARSRQAAQEMVDLFGIAFETNPQSLHVRGTAIDMMISWSGTIAVRDARGKVSKLGSPRNGQTNTELHRIGATYGVFKLISDPPHWSSNGR